MSQFAPSLSAFSRRSSVTSRDWVRTGAGRERSNEVRTRKPATNNLGRLIIRRPSVLPSDAVCAVVTRGARAGSPPVEATMLVTAPGDVHGVSGQFAG